MRQQYYVKNSDNFVYKVEMRVSNYDYFRQQIELTLVAGWDYISEESNAQGFVPADNFVESVQGESYSLDLIDETVKGRLEDEGFEFVTVEDLAIQHIVSVI